MSTCATRRPISWACKSHYSNPNPFKTTTSLRDPLYALHWVHLYGFITITNAYLWMKKSRWCGSINRPSAIHSSRWLIRTWRHAYKHLEERICGRLTTQQQLLGRLPFILHCYLVLEHVSRELSPFHAGRNGHVSILALKIEESQQFSASNVIVNNFFEYFEEMVMWISVLHNWGMNFEGSRGESRFAQESLYRSWIIFHSMAALRTSNPLFAYLA